MSLYGVYSPDEQATEKNCMPRSKVKVVRAERTLVKSKLVIP